MGQDEFIGNFGRIISELLKTVYNYSLLLSYNNFLWFKNLYSFI